MPIKKRIIQVPFESIVVDDDFNGRKEYTEIQELAKSIFDDGLLQPIGVAVRPQDDGVDKYFLVYGFRRYRALKMLREEHGEEYYSLLEVVVNEGTLGELQIRNLKENLQRKSLTPYEISMQVRRMVLAGFDQKDIGARLGRPQSWVSNNFKVATKLNPAAQTAFRNGELTLENALTLADVPEEQQKEVITQALEAESKAEAKQLIKNAANESGKKRKYGARTKPSAKNMKELVSEVSFQSESPIYTAEEQIFFNGVAAGLRIALGDAEVDPKNLDQKNKYTDANYNRRPKEADEMLAEDGSEAPAEVDAQDDAAESNGHTQSEEEFDLYALPSSTNEEDEAAAAESRFIPANNDESDEEQYVTANTGIQAIKGIDVPPKRKRGRPRKNPLPEGKTA